MELLKSSIPNTQAVKRGAKALLAVFENGLKIPKISVVRTLRASDWNNEQNNARAVLLGDVDFLFNRDPPPHGTC